MQTLHFLQQNSIFTYLSGLLLLSFLIFLISWLKEPRKLINGVLFTVFLLILAIWLTILVMATNFQTLITVYITLLMILIILITLTVAFAWLFFLWNAYFVWKYESHTLPNLLTLFIGLALIAVWIIAIINPIKSMPVWLLILLTAVPAIVLYLLIVAYNFLINLLLYQLVPRQYNQDYLIVLGAGLYNGETVTPLLAARINRAIQFAHKQIAKGRKTPKLIMSGGQGGDEKLSEAQAMANYAIDRGVPKDHILLEDQSLNTYQNMKFSARVAQNDFGNPNFRAKFFSNNYHIFRAGLYAKMAGLTANGVGSYTRFYFLPNAVVREFAGVFVMHKKRHFIIIGLIILLFIILAILTATNIIHPGI